MELHHVYLWYIGSYRVSTIKHIRNHEFGVLPEFWKHQFGRFWPILMLISCERVAISWRLVGTARGLKREEKKKERDRDRGQGERKREREKEREWRCEDEKMRRCDEDVKMRRCEDEKRERERRRESEDEKMWRWEHEKMWWRCDEGVMKMWRWQDVKMWWRCDDDVMKMWTYGDV